MSTSTIPTAIDALLDALRALNLTGVKVVDGYPRFPIERTDFIAVGGAPEPTAAGEQQPAGLGNQRRREGYTLAVYCSSSRGGENQKAVRDRAFELMAAVENVLRTDATLSGAVQFAQVGGDIALSQTDDDTAENGVFAEVAFRVSVEARI